MLTLLLALALTRVQVQPPPPDWSVWPAQGTITGPFGYDGGRRHPGIDIGILRSLAVRAAQPGRVVAVGSPRGFEGYGTLVEVALGGGYVALTHTSRGRASASATRSGPESGSEPPAAPAGARERTCTSSSGTSGGR